MIKITFEIKKNMHLEAELYFQNWERHHYLI